MFGFQLEIRFRSQEFMNLEDFFLLSTQEFVRDVGERCGFVMEEDRLRIPSTKRICFVGRRFQHTPQVDEFVNTLTDQGKTFEARYKIISQFEN